MTRMCMRVLLVCFAYSALSQPADSAAAEDRITQFSSQIVIDHDRTLHVVETLDLLNEGGTFDSGLDRRLGIAPASPQRAKPTLYSSITATVDGQEVHVET